MAEEKKIKVKILRQVGAHQPGDEVELPAELAEQLCQPSQQKYGHQTHNLQKAVKVEDFAKLKDSDVDMSLLTQVEATKLGLKNVIASPFDTHPMHVAKENDKKLEEMKSKGVDQKGAQPDNGDKKKK